MSADREVDAPPDLRAQDRQESQARPERNSYGSGKAGDLLFNQHLVAWQYDEIERLQRKLKCYEPVNTYDGLSIEQWRHLALATERALVHACFSLHKEPQYMLPAGITLINNNEVSVLVDGKFVIARAEPSKIGYLGDINGPGCDPDTR